jgi:hypothetical protein
MTNPANGSCALLRNIGHHIISHKASTFIKPDVNIPNLTPNLIKVYENAQDIHVSSYRPKSSTGNFKMTQLRQKEDGLTKSSTSYGSTIRISSQSGSPGPVTRGQTGMENLTSGFRNVPKDAVPTLEFPNTGGNRQAQTKVARGPLKT